MKDLDLIFMNQALALAVIAGQEDEVPIGSVVVSPKGDILGTGYNRTEQNHSQSRHAEVYAIERAGQLLKDWRLTDCTLYVTVEPCLMCMSLICLSRISRVVYGAESPLFGYHLDKESLPPVYRKHIRGITSGIGGEESRRLLEEFFKKRRMKGEEYKRD